jgi:hypothetical protein
MLPLVVSFIDWIVAAKEVHRSCRAAAASSSEAVFQSTENMIVPI